MVEFGTSSTFRGWVRVRVLGYGSGVRGRKVKSRDLVASVPSSSDCGSIKFMVRDELKAIQPVI